MILYEIPGILEENLYNIHDNGYWIFEKKKYIKPQLWVLRSSKKIFKKPARKALWFFEKKNPYKIHDYDFQGPWTNPLYNPR